MLLMSNSVATPRHVVKALPRLKATLKQRPTCRSMNTSRKQSRAELCTYLPYLDTVASMGAMIISTNLIMTNAFESVRTRFRWPYIKAPLVSTLDPYSSISGFHHRTCVICASLNILLRRQVYRSNHHDARGSLQRRDEAHS